ncbi:MAG: transcriptional repressor [Actinobacteria bacterium HGW-Actinobacteria-4]|nr:MAG: transcriptional repressor [Actinobacteria bacterium HGW-Actinobacteria-4]
MSTSAPVDASPVGDQLEAMLRGTGLKVTQPRLAVLRALQGRPHISADAVVALVRHELPTASLQSTYNVLTALAERGLVRRIEPAGHAGRYELRVGDNHHHAVCTRCGAITDIDCAVGHAPCLTPSGANDFSVMEAEVTFWGQCADCQNQPQQNEATS